MVNSAYPNSLVSLNVAKHGNIQNIANGGSLANLV